MTYYLGTPKIPPKDGYKIYRGTLHKGKTFRGKEVDRVECYVPVGEWENGRVGDELFHRQLLVIKRKKNETDKELEERIQTTHNLNIWKYEGDGRWTHDFGTL